MINPVTKYGKQWRYGTANEYLLSIDYLGRELCRHTANRNLLLQAWHITDDHQTHVSACFISLFVHVAYDVPAAKNEFNVSPRLTRLL